MTKPSLPILAGVCFLGLTILFSAIPNLDLLVSSWFYDPSHGFCLAGTWIGQTFQATAYYGARFLGCVFGLMTIYTAIKRQSFATIDSKGWAFLLLAILIGPVLVVNIGLKDHWGRARPRETVDFGGNSAFTPALAPQPDPKKNESFVSGDGAFGFFIPTLAYLVPVKRSRRSFYGLIAGGSLFGIARIMMGAHFTSDVLWAGIVVTLCSALTYATLYGRHALVERWQYWAKTAP